MPHPTRQRDEFIAEGCKQIVELLKISNGRALILFTAKSDMESVHKQLLAERLPYKILKANNGASQERVLNEFRSDYTSVLLGTGAYWEGINLVGETLTNVIIFRLPFPVPDPIIDEKCSRAKNKLLDVMTPEMVIKLNQGVGRLIRSERDVGIISIIDPRLSDTSRFPYREIVWDSLPIKNRTSDIDVLKEFYSRVVTQEIQRAAA
jgi:ATP-dependent DNA helicase DinG